MKTLIVEGGAMRGIFTTGVLDAFMDLEFDPFDLYMGVSSGAGNLAAFMARMPGRNFKIYTDYSLRPEFLNLGRFVRGGHLMDLDWLWETTIREIRLDLDTIYKREKPLVVCLTDVSSGKAIYKDTDAKNLEAVLKASSALPILYRAFPVIDGKPCSDGGIADPIPVRAAIDRGANQIMVIRSRPRDYVKTERVSQAFMLWRLKKYPVLRDAMADRVHKYNASVALLRKPPSGVKVVEICPPDGFQPARFSRDRKKLTQAYEQGKMAAREAVKSWGPQKESV